MFIPDPGSRIPDPKTATKERGEKICFRTFLCNEKFRKIENNFSFEVLKKKIWANFQRIIELFTQKLSPSSQKYGFGIRDPRAGKNLFRIPVQGSKRHRIADLVPQHWLLRRCWGGDPALGWNMQWQDVQASEGNPETPGQWMEQGSTVFLLTRYSTFQYLTTS